MVIVPRQRRANPPTESLRTPAHIHGNVERLTVDNLKQLPLALWML